MSCPNCGRAFEELDPRLFSFNSPHGACEECGGFGEIWDQELQTGDEETAIRSWKMNFAERVSEWIDEDEARECPSCHGSRLNEVARHVRLQGFTIDQFTDLSASEAARRLTRLEIRRHADKRLRPILFRKFSNDYASWKTSASAISRWAVPRKL